MKTPAHLLPALLLAASLHADPLPAVTRQPGEDVNSAGLRTRQGLTSGATLLFNGWGVSPAGEHVSCGDLALKILIAPDRKAAIAVCAGYNKQGVNVVSLDAKRETQFITLKEAFNGLAFSGDGKKFYVSGGDSGVIHIFNYADGKASHEREVKPDADASHVFLAGIAVHPATGALYVCNEANHEVWVLNPDTLALDDTPVIEFEGRLDSPQLNDGDKSTISITAESRMAALLGSSVRRYTDADQQKYHPGDTWCKFSAVMAERLILFPSAQAQRR